MPIDDWKINALQTPATEMCYRLGENPYEPLDPMLTTGPVRWQEYARRMVEHEAMVAAMRNAGVLP